MHELNSEYSPSLGFQSGLSSLGRSSQSSYSRLPLSYLTHLCMHEVSGRQVVRLDQFEQNLNVIKKPEEEVEKTTQTVHYSSERVRCPFPDQLDALDLEDRFG